VPSTRRPSRRCPSSSVSQLCGTTVNPLVLPGKAGAGGSVRYGCASACGLWFRPWAAALAGAAWFRAELALARSFAGPVDRQTLVPASAEQEGRRRARLRRRTVDGPGMCTFGEFRYCSAVQCESWFVADAEHRARGVRRIGAPALGAAYRKPDHRSDQRLRVHGQLAVWRECPDRWGDGCSRDGHIAGGI